MPLAAELVGHARVPTFRAGEHLMVPHVEPPPLRSQLSAALDQLLAQKRHLDPLCLGKRFIASARPIAT